MPDTSISPAEWQIRKDLAALYRLVALFGWDDTIFTHISARVAAKDSLIDGAVSEVDHFLINPYGVFFEEMTASALIKIDLDGNMVGQADGFVNPAGFTIHSALHAACRDAHFVIHLHTDAMTGVSAQKEGLLPLTQNALLLGPHLAYHDYEGVAVEHSERQRIVADLGDKKIMLLRNHGALAYGSSAGEAFTMIYFLEQACRQQIAALSAGRDGVLFATPDVQDKVAQLSGGVGFVSGLLWPGLLRRLQRQWPGWDS
ncbi:class II aldolase/adducin family protein [Asticcacaulis sp. YBE204]|uniref:class II aldolase/adducin family protein n=1 Tax=Asticcacaulis sp. YBE204 TaxID=1282363 RepID=UPI0003C3D291|nr:class II aldolase/adducin family protein [Asticcacaulis sp. YBE204]ESQ78848.1 membrane protein [Asticcacaulis sp. YBE204]